MVAVTPEALIKLREENKLASEQLPEEFEQWYAALKERANFELLNARRRLGAGKDESVVLVLVRAREARYVQLLTERLTGNL